MALNDKINWSDLPPSATAEYAAEINGKRVLAYRNRTQYGWCWWTITVDGKRTTYNGAHLPEREIEIGMRI